MKLRITTQDIRYIGGRKKTIFVLEQAGRDGIWYEIGRYGRKETAVERMESMTHTKAK